MKKALLLHGTKGTSQSNWFPWLTQQLEKDGYTVWSPDLPMADKPNIQRYNQFISDNKQFSIDKDTIIIGHSSGAVAILGLLQALPEHTVVSACYLVGSFKDDLGRNSLKELFTQPFNFDVIKSKSRLWYFIHSDNDPYCPLEHAEYLQQHIGGDLLILPGQKHFSINTHGEEYRQFPYLYHLIASDTVKAEDVLDLYTFAEENHIQLWLDGGWSVDALLEKQTRTHGDIDIVIQKKDIPAIVHYLESKEYKEIQRGDTSPYNFLYGNLHAQFVDFHVIKLDEQGNGIYGPKENEFVYKAQALSGIGTILGKKVQCISPEWVVKFHTGYQLREKDFHDVLAICETYKIEVPEEYKHV